MKTTRIFFLTSFLLASPAFAETPAPAAPDPKHKWTEDEWRKNLDDATEQATYWHDAYVIARQQRDAATQGSNDGALAAIVDKARAERAAAKKASEEKKPEEPKK